MTAPPAPATRLHAADNSAFIVGLTSHPDLSPEQMPRLIEALVSFLLELKQHLPATELKVMLDAEGPASPAIAVALQGLNISIESLSVAPAAALLRRSSLLLALWDGRSSSLADDPADLVFRFLGVRGEQTQNANRIEISTVANELDVAARLVFWISARRCGDDATAPSAHYLLSAGDSVLDVQPSMPPSLQRRLADLNEYNQDFERFSANPRHARSASLMREPAALLALSDAAGVAGIDRQFVKADSLAGYMQRQSDRLFNLFGITAFTMGLAYLVYDKITESKALLMFYVLMLFISLLTFYFFQTKRWFGKYLAYRSLAETLRVRFYLAVAGVDRVQSRALITLTGISRFPGFGWISFVLDAIEPAAADPAAATDNPALRARLVDQDWIEDQYR
ncbi:MAG: hypothetical protein ACRESY_01860, partial [Steroidobacteraceae bacterium]